MRAGRRIVVTAAVVAASVLGAGVSGCAQRETRPQFNAEETARLEVVSSAYDDGATIPVVHANTDVEGGTNVSVPVEWSVPPDGTRSFALVMVDRHPAADGWVHWMVIDLPAEVRSLSAGASGTAMPDAARELENSFGEQGYGGPAPPAGSGDHSYELTVYALDVDTVDLDAQAGLVRFFDAIEGHVLGAGTVTGVFGR